MAEVDRYSINLKPVEDIFADGFVHQDKRESTGWVFIEALAPEDYYCPAGHVNASFQIQRKFDWENGTSYEKGRSVWISDVKVEKPYRGQRIAPKMLEKLEETARKFGAAVIEAEITPHDLGNSPWLPDFYAKLGFTVIKKEAGYNLRKQL